MTLISRLLIASTATLLAITLAGCAQTGRENLGSPGTSSGSSGSDVAVSPGAADSGLVAGSAKDSSSGVAPLSNSGIGGTSTVTTTWISLTANNPVAIADQAATIATDAGGYVESRSESSGGGVVVPLSGVTGDVTMGGAGPTDYVSLTLRIPTEKASGVIAALKELGHVSSNNHSQYDVGQQQADLTARISALTESLAALRGLQSAATNVTDLLAAEAAISTRQAELDSLIAQQDYLASQIDMTAITVDVTATAVGTPANLTFIDGLVNGFNSIGTAFVLLVVGIGFILPWLGLLVILAGIALAITIPLVRRSRSRTGSGSSTGS
ncbi:MAG: DUF4349 domain-containing protein [Actinobacteria bacterium]|uniref:Unannotated protein n=1 Tax=freshwater metagenome TaxID=449393 RepID=A0A6J7F876_9ZZZZ|nr:DUF4349 domain-containing protein [Actinomycetota bacterium]